MANPDENSRDVAVRALASVLERIHATEFNLRTVMETILDYAVEAAEADVGSILIADDESDAFKLVAVRGDVRQIQRLEQHYPLTRGAQHLVHTTARHYFMPNVHADREYVELWDGIQCELILPLMHHDTCIGVLNFDFGSSRTFEDSQIEFLKLLAAQAVSAISIDRLRNGQMLARVEQKLLAREKCFVLMPFCKPFNKYYSTIIVPAAEDAGLSTFRADSLYGPANLMADIWANIKNAKVLIAELTTRNPNVMYELGLAHALHKPVILLTQDIEDVPFDLRAIRCLVYDVTDPNWASDLREQIKMSIEAIHDESKAKKRFGPFAK